MSDQFDADDVPPPPPAPAPPPPPPPPSPPPAVPEPTAFETGDLPTIEGAAPIAGVDMNPPPPPIAGVDVSPPSAATPAFAAAPPAPPVAPPPPAVEAAPPPPPPPPVEAAAPPPPPVEVVSAPPPPAEVMASPAPPPSADVAAALPPTPPAQATPAQSPPPAAAATPPTPAQPMPDAESGPGLTDPAGLGVAISRLSGSSRKAGNAAFMVMANALEAGETVSVVAQCRFRGAPGAIALTDRRLLVVNSREWEPDVLPVELGPGVTVQGWQDERRAALVFTRDGHDVVVDRIGDRAMAQEIASGVRDRSGG